MIRRVLCVLPLVLLLIASRAGAQAPTMTPTPNAAQDCCTAYDPAQPGCDDIVCQACICAPGADPLCCDPAVGWDFQCSQEAMGIEGPAMACGASCACSTRPTPTETPWHGECVPPTPTPTATPQRRVELKTMILVPPQDMQMKLIPRGQ